MGRDDDGRRCIGGDGAREGHAGQRRLRPLGVVRRLAPILGAVSEIGVMGDAVATVALGSVEGTIGLIHQIQGLAGLQGHRSDTETGRDGAVRPVPLLDSLAQPLGHAPGDDRAGHREQDGELLAAMARDRVVGAGRASEHVGDAAQHVVAGRVAKGVVVRLELVHVQHHQRERRPLAGGQGEVRLQRLEEAAAVLQSGQFVGRGQLAQSGVLPLQILLHGEQAAGDLQAGDQLPRIERLGQEIVDPGGQRLQALLAPAPAGEQDEVGVGSPGQAPDAAAQLQAIHPRHHPVGEHHLHATALQQRPGLDAVGRRHDLVAQRPEQLRHGVDCGCIILDEQDGHPPRSDPGPHFSQARPCFRHPVATVIVAEIGIHLGVVGPIRHRSPLQARPPGFLHRLIGGVMPKVNARSRKSVMSALGRPSCER